MLYLCFMLTITYVNIFFTFLFVADFTNCEKCFWRCNTFLQGHWCNVHCNGLDVVHVYPLQPWVFTLPHLHFYSMYMCNASLQSVHPSILVQIELLVFSTTILQWSLVTWDICPMTSLAPVLFQSEIKRFQVLGRPDNLLHETRANAMMSLTNHDEHGSEADIDDIRVNRRIYK